MDFVDGERFQSICDFELGQEMPKKSQLVMYAPSENYLEALVFIKQNTDTQFKLVTHNGDIEIYLDDRVLPDNLIHWYAQNLCTKSNKMSSLPIAMENTHWHPTKRPAMLSIEKQSERFLKPFTQFNPRTHPSRLDLVRLIQQGEIDVDFAPSINGTGFDQYVYNLSKYAFCICPRGNGIDTHRIWEALHMGCVPIVKRHVTHECLLDLPVLFVDDWREITHEKLVQFIEQIPNNIYNMQKLSFSYWENLIKNDI
tara:strand:+ start:457 stop:1221 length:765 start_codon:yes stop_codon:yes gene_type:complete